MTLRATLFAAFAVVVSCAPPATRGGTVSPGAGPATTQRRSPRKKPNPPPPHCDYRVKAPAGSPFVVEVRVRCDGVEVSKFVPDDERLPAFVSTGKLERHDNGVELAYTVDLDRAAAAVHRFDVAERFGASLVAGASSFLFTPAPGADGVPVRVTFDEAPGFATGLRRGPNGYTIETHELRVATYTAFGAREVRKLDAEGATLRMALLDGRIALGADRMARWVETAFRAVSTFYGQAPDAEVLVVIGPVPKERGVKFGRLLPESGPGVMMLVGEKTREEDLVEDWMLVHELFHIGSPSYGAKSGWFDEGLATYFEPLIRARAGLTTEAEVWREMASEMPRGLAALTEYGLAKGESRDDTYWGGGLFCFLADVEMRRRTQGKLGLEDGLRAVLREGGNSSEVWGFEETLKAMDAGMGAPVLEELAARHVSKGAPVELERLMRELGVVTRKSASGEASGGGGAKPPVRFDDTAPLAAIRKAIVRGKP